MWRDVISKLWKDKALQETYNISRMNNAPYLFMDDNLDRILDDDYNVTFEDYVRINHRTTGIIESLLSIDNYSSDWKLKITDVGGLRSERKKWLSKNY